MEQKMDSKEKVIQILKDELPNLTPQDLLVLAMSILQVINKYVTFKEKDDE